MKRADRAALYRSLRAVEASCSIVALMLDDHRPLNEVVVKQALTQLEDAEARIVVARDAIETRGLA